jgi:ubiquinone/menaquinone biosynthesis C-methylase UbiE
VRLRLVRQCRRFCGPSPSRGRRQPVLSEPPITPLPAASKPGTPELATYEDLGYRDVFWRARRYEDLCDRIALRALLPGSGERLIEVGAGFGRLADEYQGFGQVELLDSSEVHVASAAESVAGDPRIRVTLGDGCALPFPDSYFDAAVCVRVLHHFADPGPLLAEMGRVVRPGGVAVIEFANKRNLKSIARRILGRQDWSPFAPGSVSYKPYHFDHAPIGIRRSLRAAGFTVERTRAASLFRIAAVSRHVPAEALGRIESILGEPLGAVTPGPSVFVLARRIDRRESRAE